ncbi:MAG TPA: hypothetical protein VIA62_09180 [Thermoanaerobaculia bacterium]|jgi:hypothetical protein|nr:hypothetical protein [Thermoanaerobaculia bacterium]
MSGDVRERERLSQEAYDQVFGPFDRGEFRELTDQEWKALLDGERKFLPDPQSLALPPQGQGVWGVVLSSAPKPPLTSKRLASTLPSGLVRTKPAAI